MISEKNLCNIFTSLLTYIYFKCDIKCQTERNIIIRPFDNIPNNNSYGKYQMDLTVKCDSIGSVSDIKKTVLFSA